MPALALLARSLNTDKKSGEAHAAAERSPALAESGRSGSDHSATLGVALLEMGIAKHGLGDGVGARTALERSRAHLLASSGAGSAAARRAQEALGRLTSAGSR